MPAVLLVLSALVLSACAVDSQWVTQSQHWHDRVTGVR